MNVLLICNYKKGVGGISGQVEILQKMLRRDGHIADIFSTKASVMQRLMLPAKLKQICRNYDVIHIHCCSGWGFLPAFIGITVGRRLGKRIVLTYHGGGGEQFFAKRTRMVKHYLTHTDANIVLSGFLGDVFTQYDIPYTTIPNIIEFDDTQFRERTSIRPNFICIRTHEELYNIPCILKAFQQVQATFPEATLTLVGNGSLHDQLKQQAKQLGLHNITFTGRVDNSIIYNYLNQADIMLSSPKVDNMPVSLLEAMNAGLLVISSRVGGVPYMVEDNHTGLLFESDNSVELAGKMIWAVDNQAAAQAIIQKAHHAVNQYRWEIIKDKLYQAYGISA